MPGPTKKEPRPAAAADGRGRASAGGALSRSAGTPAEPAAADADAGNAGPNASNSGTAAAADEPFDVDAWYRPADVAAGRAKKRKQRIRDAEDGGGADASEAKETRKKAKTGRLEAASAGGLSKAALKKEKRSRKAERALKRKRDGKGAEDDLEDLLADAAESPDDTRSAADKSTEESGSDDSVDKDAGAAADRKVKKTNKTTAITKKKKGATGGKSGIPQSKRTPYGVWVGNLPFATTEATLRNFFKDCGEVARVNMPVSDTKTKTNKGFAYIDFATEKARDAGISLSERELGGRKLLIKDAKSFEGRPSLQAATPSSASGASGGGGSIGKRKVSTTLFIGNLSFGTTEDSVHRYFAKCEGLRKVRMPTFEDSGNCKGFAYLDFDTADHSAAALARHPKPYLNGRLLRVEYAGEDATLKGTPWKKRGEAAAAAAGEEAGPGRNEKGGGGNERGGARAAPVKKERRARAGPDSFEDRPLGVPDPRRKKEPGDDIAQKPASAAVVPFAGKKFVFADDDDD